MRALGPTKLDEVATEADETAGAGAEAPRVDPRQAHTLNLSDRNGQPKHTDDFPKLPTELVRRREARHA
jgi:hypothetical protein